MKPTALTLVPLAAVLAMSRPAAAQSTEPSALRATDTLGASLRAGVEREHTLRTALGLSGLALGASVTGAGALLVVEGRGEHAPIAWQPLGWTGIGVGGLLLTASIVSLLFPGAMESLERSFAEARRAGMDEEAAIEATERRWVAVAEHARTERMVGGAALLAGAAALGGAGVAVVLAPSNGGSDNARRDDAARMPLGALLGAGAVSFATAGVSMLANDSEVEASLRSWRATHAPARARGLTLGTPSVSVNQSAMTIGVGGTF